MGGPLGLAALALPLAFSGCASPALMVRMYDYRGSDVIELPIKGLSRFGKTKGQIDFQAPSGESFRGNWVKADTSQDEGGQAVGDIFSSIPSPTRDHLRDRWAWLADVGIDLSHPPSDCILLVMSGNRGTTLDGIAFFNGSLMEHDGIVGAAKDNRGHRYRIIGQTTS